MLNVFPIPLLFCLLWNPLKWLAQEKYWQRAKLGISLQNKLSKGTKLNSPLQRCTFIFKPYFIDFFLSHNFLKVFLHFVCYQCQVAYSWQKQLKEKNTDALSIHKIY